MEKEKKNKPSEKLALSKYSKMQDSFVKENKPLFTKGSLKDVYSSISHGDNSYLRIDRVETSAFDRTWIEKIENCIPELEEIVTNPRRTIITEGNVVPIELAKKTSSESVQHLSTHTQYIKEIKDNGDVIPSKILSLSNEDFYNTYENRFIATLIRRLVLFVEKRYEFVVEHALLKNTEEMRMKSRSVVDGSVVEIDAKVKVIKPADYDGIEEKNGYVKRIINVRDHLRFCYTSTFMKMLKTERDVRNPVLMTNIIRKNPTYHKCYELWRYIETYTSAGVTYSVNDSSIQLNKEMLAEMNLSMTSLFLAVRSANPSKYSFKKEKVYKPKIIRSIDDEEFEYGPYLKGPIEFVRVDKEFRKATEQTTSIYREEDIYDKPRNYEPKRNIVHGLLSREEEEYIKDLRLENHSIELLREAKDQLLSRKRRESIAFDKKAIKLVKQREIEERFEASKLAREELRRELLIQKEAREKLMKQALEDMTINDIERVIETNQIKSVENIEPEIKQNITQNDLPINTVSENVIVEENPNVSDLDLTKENQVELTEENQKIDEVIQENQSQTEIIEKPQEDINNELDVQNNDSSIEETILIKSHNKHRHPRRSKFLDLDSKTESKVTPKVDISKQTPFKRRKDKNKFRNRMGHR